MSGEVIIQERVDEARAFVVDFCIEPIAVDGLYAYSPFCFLGGGRIASGRVIVDGLLFEVGGAYHIEPHVFATDFSAVVNEVTIDTFHLSVEVHAVIVVCENIVCCPSSIPDSVLYAALVRIGFPTILLRLLL